MKKFFLKSLFLFIAFFALISCFKDHDLPPQEEPVETELAKNILGKWMIESMNSRIENDAAFIEFLSDGSYVLYNLTETLESGKYTLARDNTIMLGDFGKVTDISFDNGLINFKLEFLNKTIAFKARKGESRQISESAKLLLRNWSITDEEDGALLLSADDDPSIKFNMTLLFTPSGTYLYRYIYQGKMFDWGMGYWKQDPTNASHILTWKGTSEPENPKNYILIKEVTNDILKISDISEDGNVSNLVLKPAL